MRQNIGVSGRGRAGAAGHRARAGGRPARRSRARARAARCAAGCRRRRRAARRAAATCATPSCRGRGRARPARRRDLRGGSILRTSGCSPSSASVNPPAIAAATLSGCPSIGAASVISASVPCGRPCSASAAASPATIAALDEPGAGLERHLVAHVEREPVEGPSQTWANERTTRFEASLGSASAPWPVTVTSSGPGRRSTSTTLRNGRATPRQS